MTARRGYAALQIALYGNIVQRIVQIDEEFISNVLSLMLTARSNAGVSELEVGNAMRCMDRIRSKYKSQSSIPSAIVNILVDMQSSLITSADRHKNDLGNELMAEKIFHAAFDLSAMARDMTS